MTMRTTRTFSISSVEGGGGGGGGGVVAVFWNDPLDSMQITESFGTVHQ
jgi:hypothetical protein